MRAFDIGTVHVSGSRRLDLVLDRIATVVEESRQSSLPRAPTLGNSYPNPFNGVTLIAYGLPYDGEVNLVIYNLLGQRVKTVVRERLPAGQYLGQWDGSDDDGRSVASGVYLYVLEAAQRRITRKLLLLR